jgi:hypothetical protein
MTLITKICVDQHFFIFSLHIFFILLMMALCLVQVISPPHISTLAIPYTNNFWAHFLVIITYVILSHLNFFYLRLL